VVYIWNTGLYEVWKCVRSLAVGIIVHILAVFFLLACFLLCGASIATMHAPSCISCTGAADLADGAQVTQPNPMIIFVFCTLHFALSVITFCHAYMHAVKFAMDSWRENF